MANYEFVVVSNTFTVKEEAIDDVRRAIGYFEESYIDGKGNAFIGSYGEQTYSDDLKVVIDKRANKVLGTYDNGYYSLEDFIEENGYTIEEGLEELSIPSGEKYNIEDFREVDFADFIQQNLLEGEYAFIKEVGHEKLRYACGGGLLITKKSMKWIDLDSIAEEYAEKEKGLKP